jgi:hypothetical protein
MFAKMSQRARMMVGDGKFPNKYFVSVSNDYESYNKKENAVVYKSAGKPRYELVAEYDNANVAIEDAESRLGKVVGSGRKEFPALSVVVEDRITGEVFRHSVTGRPMRDTSFSEKKEYEAMKKKRIDPVDQVMRYESGQMSETELREFARSPTVKALAQSQGSYGRLREAHARR